MKKEVSVTIFCSLCWGLCPPSYSCIDL